MSEDLKSVLQAGLELALPRTATPEAIPFVVIPDGARLETLEEHLPAPLRIKSKAVFNEVDSFARYVQDFATESTAIFADVGENGGSFCAILDYHKQGKPGWSQHLAVYTCPVTVEWRRWREGNLRTVPQKQFAEYIENNQREIVSPPGATILEIVRSLVATSKVEFESAVRLQNGNVQFKYEKTTEARAGEKGALEIPELFSLGMALFQGGEAYALEARLRYSIEEKKLNFRYELVNPHLVVMDALNRLVAKVRTATKIEPYIGSSSYGNR